jgi:hypothetical protein
VNTGKSASEMLALLTMAYGQYAMKKSSVSQWHTRFKEGREYVQDDPRSGQPKTHGTDANVARVRTHGESTVLFRSADKVTRICSEERTQTLA